MHLTGGVTLRDHLDTDEGSVCLWIGNSILLCHGTCCLPIGHFFAKISHLSGHIRLINDTISNEL